MKKIAFTSIRQRLTFWFLVLSIVPLSIGMTISFKQEKQIIDKEATNKLISIRDLKVQQVEKWLDERDGDLRVMSGSLEIKKLEKVFSRQIKSAKDTEMLEMAEDFLIRYKRSYAAYEEIFIVGANSGLIELSSDSRNVGSNKARDLYFTKPLESGKTYIKDIYFSQTLNRLQMTFSSPLYSLEHSDQIFGVLVLRISLNQSLYSLLRDRVGLGKTGETLLVNSKGVALSELRWINLAPLELEIFAEPATKAARGETGFEITKDYRDVEVMAAFTHISRTGWGFVCKQDISELNALVHKMAKQFILLFIIVTTQQQLTFD